MSNAVIAMNCTTEKGAQLGGVQGVRDILSWTVRSLLVHKTPFKTILINTVPCFSHANLTSSKRFKRAHVRIFTITWPEKAPTNKHRYYKILYVGAVCSTQHQNVNYTWQSNMCWTLRTIYSVGNVKILFVILVYYAWSFGTAFESRQLVKYCWHMIR